MKLYKLLGEMTTTVERINMVRLSLNDRSAKAIGDEAMKNRLQIASEQVDDLRRRIVATKEGGAITGEERLREYLANLYGDVNSYEGKPSQTQTERADSLARELADITASFNAWVAKEMAGINAALNKSQLEEIKVP
jgi:polyhydroxyalkanoate synthesis regulator phasin